MKDSEVLHKALFIVNIAILTYIIYALKTTSPWKHSINKFPFKNHLQENPYLDPLDALKQFPIDFENATAVFNTVNSALKQKDSNTHPIGVSFIPAYIPANTRLYHSRSNFELPSSFEWIAFSSEFSYNFIGSIRKVKEDENEKGGDLFEVESAEPERGPVYLPFQTSKAALFTLRTKVPLDKVIYLDGASAAKISPEMDQQQILANLSSVAGPWGERDAAAVICEWGKSFGLQGIIRLEIGFEMILCDFHRDMEVMSNITVSYVNDLLDFPADERKNLPKRPHPPPNKSKPSTENDKVVIKSEIPVQSEETVYNADKIKVDYDSLSFNRSLLLNHLQSAASFEWIQSGGAVDHGEPRILLDFSNMVTPLNKTYIDPDAFRRNISYIDQGLKDEIRSDLEHVFQSSVNPFFKTNWQGMTSHLVKKFAPILVNLNKTLNSDIDYKVLANSFQIHTFNIVRRYTHTEVSDSNLQRKLAMDEMIQDYVFHSSPLHSTDYLIYSSIVKVQTEITNVIFDAFDISKRIIHHYYLQSGELDFENDVNELRHRIAEMLKMLNWTVFYQCSKVCQSDEFCFTPTWGPSPFGWGAKSGDMFNFDGTTYRINHELKCVKYNDIASEFPPI